MLLGIGVGLTGLVLMLTGVYRLVHVADWWVERSAVGQGGGDHGGEDDAADRAPEPRLR